MATFVTTTLNAKEIPFFSNLVKLKENFVGCDLHVIAIYLIYLKSVERGRRVKSPPPFRQTSLRQILARNPREYYGRRICFLFRPICITHSWSFHVRKQRLEPSTEPSRSPSSEPSREVSTSCIQQNKFNYHLRLLILFVSFTAIGRTQFTSIGRAQFTSIGRAQPSGNKKCVAIQFILISPP